MKKTIFATIIIACVAVFAVGNIAYSYFGTTLNINSNLNVGAIFTGNYTPVFTAESDGSLELSVTDADMLLADADNNNVAVSATGNINITLDAVGDSKNSTATCTFEFVFEDLATENSNGYEKYTPSSNLNGANEYTIEIKENNENVLSETSVDKLNQSSNSLVKDKLTITSGASGVTTKTYTVTAKIYNLNVDQDGIKNKKFGFKIKTTNVNCKMSWSDE